MSVPLFPPHRILALTDLGAPSRVALGFARTIHEMHGTPVDVLIGELFSSTTERVMQRAIAPLLIVPKT
jgi:hypothetical protein